MSRFFSTLYKDIDLWKKEIAQDESATDILAYKQIAEDTFSISTIVYNAALEASDSIGLIFDPSSSELVECSADVVAEFESEFLIDRSTRSSIAGFQVQISKVAAFFLIPVNIFYERERGSVAALSSEHC